MLLASPSSCEEGNATELSLRVRDGLRVERLDEVPRESAGSWVALAVDPGGRLIASDRTGNLYRLEVLVVSVTPPASPTRHYYFWLFGYVAKVPYERVIQRSAEYPRMFFG